MFLEKLITAIESKNGVGDKQQVEDFIVKTFKLVKDRKVYSCKDFAIRFSYSAKGSFSNTVLSLSALEKYDNKPMLVCLIGKQDNKTYLMNSSFIKKVSHSSKELTTKNIKGSINGSDIMKEFGGLSNSPENFDYLFAIHKERTFAENLEIIVENTNGIVPNKKKYQPENLPLLYQSPFRAKKFLESVFYEELKNELDSKLEKYSKEILIASYIDNVNIRGRIIEYIIAGEDQRLKENIIQELHKNKSNYNIPPFVSENQLGDFKKVFNDFNTETDIKTKIIALKSNPKGYNIDKFLEFLSQDKSVFMFYFIGITEDSISGKNLVSVFDNRLLETTIFQHHWSGRATRGVAQFHGQGIEEIIEKGNKGEIDINNSTDFLQRLISL